MDVGGWDLEAVVRGCRGAVRSTSETDPFSFLPIIAKKEEEEEEEDEGLGFLSEVFPKQRAVIHELEELCKPFFIKSPGQQQQKPQLSPQKTCHLPSEYQIRQPQGPRAKRRKNQQKKVVRQAPAEGPSDMWAWRKYGQKPIKGSPYPRGYYRCSSSKGCFARKQVERSRSEPDKLIITYTGEHNHPAPAHRNSLAGSTRHKFPSSSASSPTSAGCKPLSSDLSPSTPLTSSVDDELLFPPQKSGEEVEGDDGDDDEENLLFLADMEILKDEDFLFSTSSVSPVDAGRRLTFATDDLGIEL